MMNMRNRELGVAILSLVAFALLTFFANSPLLTLIGILLLIVVAGIIIFMPQQAVPDTQRGFSVENPPLARRLFETTQYAPLWLFVRLFVGWSWLDAGLHKLGDPAWMSGGTALRGFWERAASIPETGRPAITYNWYRDFLQGLINAQSYTWFGPLVAIGETLIGLALILGAFVGIAAAAGAFMNFNFMLAGSSSSNPVLFALAGLLILAWKVAGYYGLDRFLLPRLGVPWHPGTLFSSRRSAEPPAAS
jgi:thiosulfate dehydrogenase [quinone] large subunit